MKITKGHIRKMYASEWSRSFFSCLIDKKISELVVSEKDYLLFVSFNNFCAHLQKLWMCFAFVQGQSRP
jgi:hypothetical protein